jgi:hypothetical protein
MHGVDQKHLLTVREGAIPDMIQWSIKEIPLLSFELLLALTRLKDKRHGENLSQSSQDNNNNRRCRRRQKIKKTTVLGLGLGGVLIGYFLKFTLLSNYAGAAFKSGHIHDIQE